jgi:hypothetical protein
MPTGGEALLPGEVDRRRAPTAPASFAATHRQPLSRLRAGNGCGNSDSAMRTTLGDVGRGWRRVRFNFSESQTRFSAARCSTAASSPNNLQCCPLVSLLNNKGVTDLDEN